MTSGKLPSEEIHLRHEAAQRPGKSQLLHTPNSSGYAQEAQGSLLQDLLEWIPNVGIYFIHHMSQEHNYESPDLQAIFPAS